MMTISRLLLLISLLTLVLVACGQRGPLYLPDDSAPVAVPAPASQPPAAQPAVPSATPTGERPDPLDSGFESEATTDEDDPEDDEANGL